MKPQLKKSGGFGIGIAGGWPYAFKKSFVIIIELLFWEIAFVWPHKDDPIE